MRKIKEEIKMINAIKIAKIAKKYALPVLMGAGTVVSAIADQKKEAKIDELIKTVEKLKS